MLPDNWKLPANQRKRTGSPYINGLQKTMTLKRMLKGIDFAIASSKDMILFCSARMQPTAYHHVRLALHIQNKERIQENGFTITDIIKYFG